MVMGTLELAPEQPVRYTLHRLPAAALCLFSSGSGSVCVFINICNFKNFFFFFFQTRSPVSLEAKFPWTCLKVLASLAASGQV